MAGSPAAQRRRLGRLLRSLREEKSLNGEAAAAAAERSASWLSRIESGQAALRLRELRDLLDLYEMTDPVRRADLEKMATAGRQRGWWLDFSDVMDPSIARFVGLESEATAILTFEDHALPGLLQSPAYMRSLFRLGLPRPTAEEIESMAEFRTRRQEILHDEEPPRFSVILDEAVFHRPVGGPEVAYEQLTHLLAAIDHEIVDFRVLLSKHERMPLHAFTILQFAEDPTVAQVDTLTGGFLEDGAVATKTYETIFSHLSTIALDPSASRQMVQDMKEAIE